MNSNQTKIQELYQKEIILRKISQLKLQLKNAGYKNIYVDKYSTGRQKTFTFENYKLYGDYIYTINLSVCIDGANYKFTQLINKSEYDLLNKEIL